MKNARFHFCNRSDPDFDDVLRSAMPRTPLPHNFQQGVWRRIEAAGDESVSGRLRRYFDAFLVFFAKPVPAAGAVILTVAAGLWLGAREADFRGKSAYKVSVSPFAESHHPEPDK